MGSSYPATIPLQYSPRGLGSIDNAKPSNVTKLPWSMESVPQVFELHRNEHNFSGSSEIGNGFQVTGHKKENIVAYGSQKHSPFLVNGKKPQPGQPGGVQPARRRVAPKKDNSWEDFREPRDQASWLLFL